MKKLFLNFCSQANTSNLIKKSVNNFLLVLLFAVGNITFSNAQVASGYVFSESSGVASYTPLPSPTILVAAGTAFTDAIYTIPPIVNFNFNGLVNPQIYVSENGFITFGTAPTNTNYTPISSTETYSGAVAAYGMNLTSAASTGLGEISYQKLGSAGNEIFVVQYKNCRRMPVATSLSGNFNVQIRLYQATNVVEIIYNSIGFTSGSATFAYGQVGLRGSNNLDYNNRTNPSAYWPATNAGSSNTATLSSNSASGYTANAQFLWTPCYNPKNLLLTLQGDNSTLDVNWTSGAIPATTYDYEIRTNGAAGSGAVGLFASGSTALTSVTIPGLSVGVPYTVYVKSNCKTWTSNINSTITPTCATATIPYIQDFESSNVPVIPSCNTTQIVSGLPIITKDNTSIPFYGFTSKNMITTGSGITDVWYYTQKINFPSAGSYHLSYTYGGTREFPQFLQNLKVYMGLSNTPAGMTTLIEDIPNIKDSPIDNSINFNAPGAGDYYIGFEVSTTAINQGNFQLDDIKLDFTTCLPPTALTFNQITSGSTIVQWTPPASPPANGYLYYYNTTGVAPVNATFQLGSTVAGVTQTTISGLNSSTTYYVWVRSSCGGGDNSQWSAVGSFTTLPKPIAACVPTPFTTTDGLGLVNVTWGSINNSTGVESNNYGDYSNLVCTVPQTVATTMFLTFNTINPGYYYTVWIDFNDDGVFGLGEQITGPLPYIGATVTVQVPITFNVSTSLGLHRVRIGYKNSSTAMNPCITTFSKGGYEDYAVLIIGPPPTLTLSSSGDTVCGGVSTPTVNVTSVISDFQIYSWSPSLGVTGTAASGYVFNPLVTTKYVLTASKNSGDFSYNSATYTVTVKATPTPITVTPASVSMCATATTALKIKSTGGSVSGVTILQEDFNGVTNSFTTEDYSYNGNCCGVSAWTLHPSPYTTPTAAQLFISNDNSQFYLSDSDPQGPTGQTVTYLISPVFSIPSTYTAVELSYWHYYRPWIVGTAEVQISTDGGVTYTTLPGQIFSTTVSGGATLFKNMLVDLSAYIGFSNMRLRFKYDANFGYRWAVDNVHIYGDASSTTVWTPTTGLYTSTAATTPYGGGIQTTVYAKPTTTTIYTATATAPSGCFATATATVTVNAIAGGVASGDQSICSSTAAPLTLAGYSGTIAQWESSADNFATAGVPIPNTTATLSSAEMGVITTTKYFRAKITNGTCTAYSNVVTITAGATATWNGTSWSNGTGPTSSIGAIFAGNYSSSGNLDACGVTVTSGNVVFNSNHTLNVVNAVTVSGGSLTFNNNASLVQTNNVANSGNITYNRNTTPIGKFDYTYWSSPVALQTLSNLSPNTQSDKYYWFNPAVGTYNWVSVPSLTAMTPGLGYIVRGPNIAPYDTTPTVYPASFIGVPNNGTITVPVTYTDATHDLNCIGNPYPSAINADLLLTDAANSAIFGAGSTLMFWTHKTPITAYNYTMNDYAYYNFTGLTGVAASSGGPTPSGKIAAGQGFVAKVKATGNVTFKNSMRVVGNNAQFYKSATETSPSSFVQSLERNRIWINLTNTEGLNSQILVGYITNATNDYESGYDGEMIPVGNPYSFYTVLDKYKLAIQGRALPFDKDDTVAIGFKTDKAGEFAIQISDFDGLFSNQAVYLEDKQLDVIHNLKDKPYTFVTEAGTFDSRFNIIYTNRALDVKSVTAIDKDILVYKQNKNINIQSVNTIMKSVQIYDIRGRMILEKNNIDSNTTEFVNITAANEFLLVKVTTGEGVVVTKKVIF